MNIIERTWNSSLGKKYVMAITGAGLFVFLIGHLVGNLQVFGPPELINGYAHFLKSKPALMANNSVAKCAPEPIPADA